MADHETTVTGQRNKRVIHEGPKNHYLTFALSIILTLLAFVAVSAGFSPTFTIVFIVTLAFVQALFQLVVWMHLKDRGHTHPIWGLVLGFTVALTCIAMAVWWMWW